MVAIADGVDAFMTMFGCIKEAHAGRFAKEGAGSGFLVIYTLLLMGWLVVWGRFSSRDFSAIVTAASYVQLAGFLILSAKIRRSKSVRGLSSKTITLWILFYSCRLTATALKSGYNPVDRTGDFMYQFIDFCSLATCLHLLYGVHKTHAHSYQEEHDTLPIGPLVVGCVILGYFARANFNRHPLFDTMFAISVNLETIAMVPQLWMLAKLGGQVDSMTAHFVAATFLSTVCTFTWWWYCAPELEKRGPCLLAKVIICGQMLRLLLTADFMYYYALSWLCGTEVLLPQQEGVMQY